MTDEEQIQECSRMAKAVVDAGVPDECTAFTLTVYYADGKSAFAEVTKAEVEGTQWPTIH